PHTDQHALHDALPISSGMAIAKSGTPKLFTSPARALYPAKVPITAPIAPSSAPTMREAPPATARHAPVSAPITIRAVSGPAVVRDRKSTRLNSSHQII